MADSQLTLWTGVETAGTKDWLEPTRKLLGSLDEQALQESDQALVDSTALEMHSILDPVLQGTWKPTAEKSLRKIVQSPFEPFRMLHSSKALFQIEFTPAASPRGKLAFDAAMMQVLASEEDHGALRNQLLQVSVFPGVFKYGDKIGNNGPGGSSEGDAHVQQFKVEKRQATVQMSRTGGRLGVMHDEHNSKQAPEEQVCVC
ncbi:hypothetical protein LTR17_027435 [Elasticomyces elasticus]|nr:hypothetical protein LTR17_027435 [Elasticomyces elasticus]